jgi:alkylation response protein AidB-like acyl-CoA dehydrogenase
VLDYTEPERVTRLRTELRDLIRELIPPGFLGAFTHDPADFELAQRFCRELGRRRLLTLAWPRRYGGADADIWQQAALREEMWAAHEPRGAQYMGLNWVGPAIMRHGTEEQRARHLPPIAAGTVVWCQGFSEPEAGSDLPALRTRATRVDGGWLINGQKVWTSYAGMAQWCFLLARVGTAADRRDGITVFLVDMAQPGIEVRPISSMLGPHHLNEVYFDDVWVPDSEVLGEVGHGWTIVTEVLRFERIGIARYARCEKLLRAAPAALGDAWDRLPASLRERWALALVHTRQARLLAYRVLAHAENGSPEPLAAALYRIAVTTLDQEVAEVLMEIVGNRGLGTNDMQVENDRLVEFVREVEDHWRYAQASTVASGTLEMNKQVVARAVLS